MPLIPKLPLLLPKIDDAMDDAIPAPGALTDRTESDLMTLGGTAPRTGLGDLGLVAKGCGKRGALRLISPNKRRDPGRGSSAGVCEKIPPPAPPNELCGV